jgi:hypothetical protein
LRLELASAVHALAQTGHGMSWFPEVPSFIKEIEEIENGNDLKNGNQIDRCLNMLELS